MGRYKWHVYQRSACVWFSRCIRVPTSHNNLVVSDVSRFVFCLGANPFGAADLDPLLIRWSDQESLVIDNLRNESGR